MSTEKEHIVNNEIGERIKTARRERGLSQDELATILKITKGYVSKIEKNQKNPSPHLTTAIEQWLQGKKLVYTQGDTATNASVMVKQNGSRGKVTTNYGSHIELIPGDAEQRLAAMELTPREQALILKLRRYAPQAMWERLEDDLEELEKRYG